MATQAIRLFAGRVTEKRVEDEVARGGDLPKKGWLGHAEGLHEQAPEKSVHRLRQARNVGIGPGRGLLLQKAKKRCDTSGRPGVHRCIFLGQGWIGEHSFLPGSVRTEIM